MSSKDTLRGRTKHKEYYIRPCVHYPFQRWEVYVNDDIYEHVLHREHWICVAKEEITLLKESD